MNMKEVFIVLIIGLVALVVIDLIIRKLISIAKDKKEIDQIKKSQKAEEVHIDYIENSYRIVCEKYRFAKEGFDMKNYPIYFDFADYSVFRRRCIAIICDKVTETVIENYPDIKEVNFTDIADIVMERKFSNPDENEVAKRWESVFESSYDKFLDDQLKSMQEYEENHAKAVKETAIETDEELASLSEPYIPPQEDEDLE